jgi:hypothetical protein
MPNNGGMPDDIPTEVQLMAKEFIRTCLRHKVAVTGFMFQKEPPFVMLFGNLKESAIETREIHEMLFTSILRDPNDVIHVKIYKSDA